MKESAAKIILLAGFIVYCVINWQPGRTETLTIWMLNVGQGDGLYIRTPEGRDIVIDGGRDRTMLFELGSVMPPYDHEIDLVIATHPDMDHIAGLAELPSSYSIGTLITNGQTKDLGFAQELDQWDERGIAPTLTAYRGWNLQIEQDLWLEFLHPNPAQMHGDDPNTDSVTFILHYKEFCGVFTGDLTIEIEQELVKRDASALDCHLLKVGHHGSHTSTSAEFVNAITPAVALISLGVDNEYGHPHAGPLYRLNQAGAQIFRTDLHGRARCKSNGQDIGCTPQK